MLWIICFILIHYHCLKETSYLSKYCPQPKRATSPSNNANQIPPAHKEKPQASTDQSHQPAEDKKKSSKHKWVPLEIDLSKAHKNDKRRNNHNNHIDHRSGKH